MLSRVLAVVVIVLFSLVTVGFVLAQEAPREDRPEEVRDRGRPWDLSLRVFKLEQQVERLRRAVDASNTDKTNSGETGKSDKPSTAASELKIFTLAHADAVDLMKIIQALYLEGREDRFRDRPGDQFRVRVACDKRTNSVIVISDPEHLRTIEAVLMRLDEQPSEE